ncbi:methyltransferase [Shewanella sp.]|uniref:methyltransferase n=1 Tax=Shewanella sp. TaxID=50422 RepID=UPI003563B4B4
MHFYNHPKSIHAFDAKFEAQKIAFAPVSFQVARCLIEFGILAAIDISGGTSRTALAATPKGSSKPISDYGLGVLLDMGMSMGLIWQEGEYFHLDKTGHFLLHDEMTRTNLNFMHHICYQGMFSLEQALLTGKPEGLTQFGDWKTLYPALSSLPEAAKESWFSFDQFYSDHAFDTLLPLVLADKPAHLVDIGGNTGKWARSCCSYDNHVQVTIMDLPQQIALARRACSGADLVKRIQYLETNLLESNPAFVEGADIYWMSQFLDCFSKKQILNILKHTANAMTLDSKLFILETFWDKQPNAASAYCINATSLYFTAIANGNSRMYHSKVFIELIDKAGLSIDWQQHGIGLGHSLLCCTKK